ncbi:TMEM165/GDT1 family protein [Serpentinicella sp. ANB-PHB4]|uniref:TMEM165/GDT1 family protein n=1 Tax=Serpentinicella sp. ANB-PHB4 TaxID=3074076 RepID=UPI0028634ACF|nr:TMEM165/GDT1 family protein [Serpentinicella sp. ANB-PHB4]MDR5658902.1 TMEM165/GDT1 family protein [Serpentinicella sp. ANB-PHB4]
MLKTIITTFLIVFVAELGDKTQLQTMLLATQSKSIWPVFIGASLALILSSIIGVLAGTFLTKYIPPSYLQNAAGVVFIVIGILTLSGKF